MLNVAICDDTPEIVRMMESHISSYSDKQSIEIHVDTYESGEEFLQSFEARKYSMVFLDIEMGSEIDGMTVARAIWHIDKHVAIVFATGHGEYVYDAVELHPFCYLVKPVLRKKVWQVLTDYYNIFEEQHLFFKYKNIRIPMHSICYIEKYRDKMVIVTDSGELETYGTLKQVSRILDESFVRCHKGFIVNMSKIVTFSQRDKHSECELIGCKGAVTIGAHYLDEFKISYAKYTKKHWRYKE